MRNLDKPLFWVYEKTKESMFSSVKGLFMSLALIVVCSIILGSYGIVDSWWASIIMTLFSLLLPLSMGFIAIKLKFRPSANSIPRAELVYARQSDNFIRVEGIVRSAASIFVSLMIYVWFAMLSMLLVMPIFHLVSVPNS